MKRGKKLDDLHFSVFCACVYLVWYRGMAAVPESANRIEKACKMKQNLTMLQGQGCRARIVKLLEKACKMKQKGDCRINRFILQSPFSTAGAPWRGPERSPARPGARGAPLVKTLKRHGNSCISQLGARGDSRERACGPGRGLERRGAVGKHGKSEKPGYCLSSVGSVHMYGSKLN